MTSKTLQKSKTIQESTHPMCVLSKYMCNCERENELKREQDANDTRWADYTEVAEKIFRGILHFLL